MDDLRYYQRRCRSGVVEIFCRKSRSFWKKKDPEQVWKQCTLSISDSEMLQYYRNRKNHGEVPLTEIHDVVAFRSTNNLMYPFRVHFNGEDSPWTINTHSEHERREWMEAIANGSTQRQWTDTQLRHTATYDRVDQLLYTTQESGPYVDPRELNIPPPLLAPHNQLQDQPTDSVQEVNISSEPSNGSHYLTLLPPDALTDNDTREDLPELSPVIAFATEFMKNFDPVQVDLMVQILLSAVTCSANRSGRIHSESCPPPPPNELSAVTCSANRSGRTHSESCPPPPPIELQNDVDSHQNSLMVPSCNEDSVSCMSNNFEGPYHRLADLWISLKESDLSSIEMPDKDLSQNKCDSNEENQLFAPIGDLLIDQPSSVRDVDSSSAEQVLKRKAQLPQSNLSRHNAICYKKPFMKRKSPVQSSRSHSSSETATTALPPPLPPKSYKQNPDAAVSKLRNMVKRASSGELLDDDKSTKYKWSKASASAENETPWRHNEHYVPIPPLPWSAFSNVQKIGEGQFGATYTAVMTDTGLQVALKSKPKTFSSRVEKDEYLREIAILKQMQCPSIAKLYGYISEFEGDMMIVQEFLPRGNLKHFLTHNKRSMSQLVKYMLDIAMGMHYISAKGLIHKKLAARNILIGENDQCKVADLSLGLKCDLNSGSPCSNSSTPHDGVDTNQPHSLLRWMAPECLLRNTFSTASDVWSFGVLQWEILMVPAFPYQSVSDEEYLDEVTSGVTLTLSTPRDCPTAVIKIMNECWNEKPSSRPSFLYISSCLTNLILDMNIPCLFAH